MRCQKNRWFSVVICFTEKDYFKNGEGGGEEKLPLPILVKDDDRQEIFSSFIVFAACTDARHSSPEKHLKKEMMQADAIQETVFRTRNSFTRSNLKIGQSKNILSVRLHSQQGCTKILPDSSEFGTYVASIWIREPTNRIRNDYSISGCTALGKIVFQSM